MKLVSYESKKQLRPGVVEGEFVVDVEIALDLISERRSANSKLNAAVRAVRKAGAPPRDLVELLGRGPRYRGALSAITQSLAEDQGLKNYPKGLFTALASARLRAPIPRPSKITCIGLNYADHAREQGSEPPSSPIFFLKSINTICSPGDPVRAPCPLCTSGLRGRIRRSDRQWRTRYS